MRNSKTLIKISLALVVLAALLGAPAPASAGDCGRCVQIYFWSEWYWDCWDTTGGTEWWCYSNYYYCTEGTGGCVP